MASIDSTTGQIVTPPTPTVAPIPAPTASTVYSAPNIVQAATSPALPVNQAVEEYNAYMNTPELTAARNSVSELQKAINSERAGLRNTTTGLEYQNDNALGTTGASMNLIGRQVGRANELSSNRQAALGDQFSAATAYLQGLENTRKEQYQVYTQEKQRIQELIAQTGNKAGISPTDTYEVAVEKAYKWQEDEKKKEEKKAEEAKKDAYKESLKKELRAMGKSTKGSIKDLEKKLKKENKEAYEKTKSRSDKEWDMKVASFNKSMNDTDKKGTKITALLTKAANMSSGGEAWAKKNAALYGLKESDVTPYLTGNWGDGYRDTPKSVAPKKIGVDSNGEDIFVDSDGNRVEWVD